MRNKTLYGDEISDCDWMRSLQTNKLKTIASAKLTNFRSIKICKLRNAEKVLFSFRISIRTVDFRANSYIPNIDIGQNKVSHNVERSNISALLWRAASVTLAWKTWEDGWNAFLQKQLAQAACHATLHQLKPSIYYLPNKREHYVRTRNPKRMDDDICVKINTQYAWTNVIQ